MACSDADARCGVTVGILSTRATQLGGNTGIVVCVAVVLWATLTGALGYDMGFNFEMTPMLIGLFSHGILFVVG